MKKLATILALTVIAAPAFAEGDAAKGEKAFKACKSCHTIKSPEGEVIYKGGKTGPNLYGILGRTAGSDESFKKYKKSLQAAGEKGLVWDAENILEYAKDPKAFLKTYLDDPKAKSGMTFKLKKDGEHIVAYLASVAPAPAAADAPAEDAAAPAESGDAAPAPAAEGDAAATN